jgi:hypothetical protein
MINFQPILNKIASNPKLIFLIDGFGAILSVFLLGVILVKLEILIGMPSQTLYLLASIAGFFSAYSFICAFRITKNWRIFLRIIASANLSYCVLTSSLLFYHRSELTTLGVIYFLLEIFIIAGLAIFEFKLTTHNMGLKL